MKPRFHCKLGGYCEATNKDSKLRTLKAPQPGCQGQAPPCCFSGVIAMGRENARLPLKLLLGNMLPASFLNISPDIRGYSRARI